MRNLAIAAFLTMNCFAALAQENCANQHPIFQMPKDKTPATVSRLGQNPQFTAIRHSSSADEVYNKIKTSSSSEMNGLMKSLGYSGVQDPAFDRGDVAAANLPYGSVGMMGDGNNNYKHAILMLPGQTTIPAWKIDANNNGCDLYVLNECGNAFYYSNAPATVTVTQNVVQEYAGNAKLKVKVYGRYRETENCKWCGKCDQLGPDEMTEGTVLMMEQDINEIPVTRDGSNYPEKVLYVDIDKKTYEKMKKSGDVQVSYTPSKPDFVPVANVQTNDEERLVQNTTVTPE